MYHTRCSTSSSVSANPASNLTQEGLIVLYHDEIDSTFQQVMEA